eukprot:gene770-955_t
MESDKLGDRMKGYESESAFTLKPNQPFIIRLDGHGFSKFTRSFKKPWDIRIHNAMVRAAEELLKTFNAPLAYTFSDEITLCFPSVDVATFEVDKEGNPVIPVMMYNGKIQKLGSLSAGLASTIFYKSITDPGQYDQNNEADVKILKHLESALPHFDARIFVLPDNQEIHENLVWRSLCDCRRNSVSVLGQSHFSPKVLHGLKREEIIQKLLTEKNIDYHLEPDWYKYGVYIKKIYFEMDAINLKTNENITALRHKFVHYSFNIKKIQNALDFIQPKVLPENYTLTFLNDNVVANPNST